MSTTEPSTSHPELSSEDTVALFQKYVVPNYRRYAVNLVRGSGSTIWDAEGNEYLDLFPGWGCNLLGHCPEMVVEAVQEQVAKLIHVPNTWHLDVQGQWAQMLSDRSFGGQAFFCNSGAEANEAAIKLARLHTPEDKFKIVTFLGGFHGRTFGAVTATAQPKYHQGIGPMMAGFSYCPHGDLDAVRELVDEQTCAIMVEPIQGEGGVKLPPEGFLQGLREIADEKNLLLIFDEVQTGCGRTGEWFAYQHFGVQPDIMTLAKSLCGGISGGALMASVDVAKSLVPGMHAATFGGNPIAARAGIAAIEQIERDNLLDNAKKISQLFSQRLNELKEKCDIIQEIRVAGLMIGIELTIDGSPVVQSCLDQKLLINCTQGQVLRLLPAMNVTEEEVHRGCDILTDVLTKLPA